MEPQISNSIEIRNSIVTIVIVAAKCLPTVSSDGASHSLYCKFRLGLEKYKTRSVTNTLQPEWRERFQFNLSKDNLLKISLWDKGKQKSFMGSCVLDLSTLGMDRTHDIWQHLDDGFGLIHMSITICVTRSDYSLSNCLYHKEDSLQEQAIFSLSGDLKQVGMLHVKVLSAKGLFGKPNAYCTLELDNERVQTPNERSTSEPTWNKCFVFNVYDVTSTLDVKVHDSSFPTTLLNSTLGKVSIPLLKIVNRYPRWYALKDKNKRNNAKGNCPRVCLQMTLIWNPIKASMKLFRPKQLKYLKKPPKFNIGLMYKNVKFVEAVFNFLYRINQEFKQLFEWNDRESSLIGLLGWLLFCFYFQLWTVPLLLLLPFIYYWFSNRYQDNTSRYQIRRTHSNPSERVIEYDKTKEDKSLAEKLQGLQTMTLTVTSGMDYLASVAERLFNLVSHKVPFLSFMAMIILVASSLVLYFVPFNYLLMILGIYKFTRKYSNPDRILNNDLLDFIFRIPDNETLKDWKELSVPEPEQTQSTSKMARSI